MDAVKINIVIYSEEKDNTLITAALNEVLPKNCITEIAISSEITEKNFDLVIAFIKSRTSNILEQLIKHRDQLGKNIIFVLEEGDNLLISTLAKLGFTELYLFPDELIQFSSNLGERLEEITASANQDFTSYSIDTIIGKGENASEKISIAKKAAQNPAINLLIYGESGTGKGLLANAIHNEDQKSQGSFVEVICTAIPDTLLESELFGYEKGAFTDAKNRKVGLFELAENGTIFLDEIGDLNLGLQAKLLNVIEKKVFRRLGGVEDIPLRARIVSATNRNLTEMIEAGQFRLDLYYRLSVVSIALTPLRFRRDEVITIAKNYIKKLCKLYNKEVKKVDTDVYNFINEYSWPGNWREFKNTLEMCIIMLDDTQLTLNYFKNFIQRIPSNGKQNSVTSDNEINLSVNYENTDLEQITKLYAQELFKKCVNNKTRTAKLLGISRPKLDNLLN